MNRLLLINVICLTIFCSCVNYETKLKVNKDGSGTIVETLLMNKFLIKQMDFISSMDKKNKKKKNFYEMMSDKAILKKRAKKMGKDVQFVKVLKKEKNGQMGLTTYFTFSDINNVSLSLGGQKHIILSSINKANKTIEESDGLIKFLFNKSKESRLEIFLPKQQKKVAKNKEESVSVEQIEMIKATMKDARLAFIIEVNGKIIKTNSTVYNDNSVTPIKLNFLKIVSDEALLKKIFSNNFDFQQLKKMTKKIPGVIIEEKEKIFIVF
jgi:predicted phage tail protein